MKFNSFRGGFFWAFVVLFVTSIFISINPWWLFGVAIGVWAWGDIYDGYVSVKKNKVNKE